VRVVEDPVSTEELAIYVGPEAAAHIIAPNELARLGKEGYILRTADRSLAIAGGRPRGTLYGVYSFLEDHLGCRWFTPDLSRIPSRERVVIAPIDRMFVPRLEYRATDYPNSRDADWAARNKINGTQTRLDDERGGKVAYGPFVHTFNSILNPEQHFESHPEYFSEVDGKRVAGRTQLCLTNPEVLGIATETVRRWMREQPSATIFSVSQNDWHNYCTCRECTQVIEQEGSSAGVYLRFVNAIADAIGDEYPDKAIDTLAYQFTRRPPTQTVPRANVIVRLCDIECCFAHPLVMTAGTDRQNADFADDLRRWSEISDRLYIWDYVINYAHSIMPFPNLYTLKPNINFFLEHGVKGIYEEANYFSPGGEFAELRTWIIAKTLWDPTYDTDRAIDEFLAGYYEKAAIPLRRYIDLIHGKAKMDGIHFRIYDAPTSPLFSQDVLARAVRLLDEAEQAVTEKPQVLGRVELACLPIMYVQIAKLVAALQQPETKTGENIQQLRSLFDRFDQIARKEGVTSIREGRSYESWATQMQDRLSRMATAAADSPASEACDDLPPAPSGRNWKLIWSDEFEGDRLDESKWAVPPDGRRRDGWWKRKAISLDGKGHLEISTFKEGDQYVDGCVRTKGRFEHAFGYYVARIALGQQPGHWSAFWLMGDGVTRVGNEGRDGTEIDIMEKPWLDDRVQHTLHWDGYGKEHNSSGTVSRNPGIMTGFHTFALKWTPDEYVFYVDGRETWRTSDGGVCQSPLYIKLSDEIGKWGGDISQAQLPDRFLVDYVRVYDLVDQD
jgi:beta-glucanase (GH16 family)